MHLFANENIHHELHVLICQPPNSDYIVVHGVTYSADQHSNGKMTYVSIVPTCETGHSVHLRYELLPPHPPFVTSISLKIPGVVLLNSGDVLFAILLKHTDAIAEQNDCDNLCYCEIIKNRANCGESTTNSQDSVLVRSCSQQEMDDNEIDPGLVEVLSDNIFPSSKIGKVSKDGASLSQKSSDVINNIDTLQQKDQSEDPHGSPCYAKVVPVNTKYDDNTDNYNNNSSNNSRSNDTNNNSNVSNTASDGNNNNSSILNSSSEEDDSSGTSRMKDYISFVLQGYCLSDGGYGTPDSLPSSPFDCTTQVLPCHLSSLDGTAVLKHVYEHRCFKNVHKGTRAQCDYFIGQAHFDTENFVNEEIQQCSDISRRFVSIRDYDTQMVDVCAHSKEVIILINALVVLRNTVPAKACPSGVERIETYKLSLYTLGYIVSWNVYDGCVTVLKRYPVVEGPGTICKSRQFSPSLSQAVQLRKGFFVPTAKNSSVQTLSNHTVFSGKSLQYLFNPVLPVAVIM